MEVEDEWANKTKGQYPDDTLMMGWTLKSHKYPFLGS